MTVQIDTTAVNNGVRLAQQNSHPASPASGYEILYVVSGSSNGGLFLKDSSGRQIGPFITGSSSGLTMQYPPLKPATPTYDFNSASLDGAFSAHSSQGSFATTDCITQSPYGVPGSTLAMMFNAQMGGLYVSHADTDLDFHVGDMQLQSMGPADGRMMGIAALDSSGNGVGVLVYSDNSAYIVTVTAWNYAANSNSWIGTGLGTGAILSVSQHFWLRLKRVSGTWTAYASLSGKAWDHTFTTRSDAVTVDRLFFGLLYNTTTPYYGILTADYLHIDV